MLPASCRLRSDALDEGRAPGGRLVGHIASNERAHGLSRAQPPARYGPRGDAQSRRDPGDRLSLGDEDEHLVQLRPSLVELLERPAQPVGCSQFQMEVFRARTALGASLAASEQNRPGSGGLWTEVLGLAAAIRVG